MSGETNLTTLISNMTPFRNEGEYVFVSIQDPVALDGIETICKLKEPEGISVVLRKSKADELKMAYDFVASWITLSVHSSLVAVGLTAAVATALMKHQIPCNIIAGYYHDHLFVDVEDAEKAMEVLEKLSKSYS